MAYWNNPNSQTPSADAPLYALIEVLENAGIAARSSAHKWAQVGVSARALHRWVDVSIRYSCSACSTAAIVRLLQYWDGGQLRYFIPTQMFSKSCKGLPC